MTYDHSGLYLYRQLSVCSLSINLIPRLLLTNQRHDRLMAISIWDGRASLATSILIVEVTQLGMQEWEARLTLARNEVNLGKLREANSSYAECLVSLPCFHHPAMHICTSRRVFCVWVVLWSFQALKVALCWKFPPVHLSVFLGTLQVANWGCQMYVCRMCRIATCRFAVKIMENSAKQSEPGTASIA